MAMTYENNWGQPYEREQWQPEFEDVRLAGFSGGSHHVDQQHRRLQARLRAATTDQPTLIGSQPPSPVADSPTRTSQPWQDAPQLQHPGSAASLLSSTTGVPRIGEKKQFEHGFELKLHGMEFARNILFLGLAIFAPPFWALMRVGLDPQVAYWLPSTHIVAAALLLPFICVLVFVANSARGRPVQLVMGVGFLSACVLLMVVSNHVLRTVHAYGNILSATDCDTWPDKRNLELEWTAAQTFYASCMSATANQTGIPFAQIASTYVITDCGLYDEKLKEHPGWKYLGTVEAQLYCAGWCRSGPPLWTRQTPGGKDSCSTSVAQVLSSSIQRLMTQVAVYALVILCALSILFVTSEPLFTATRLKL